MTHARSRIAHAVIALILIGFTALAAVDLSNVRPVSGDDVIILSITERWLQDGRMGSPLYEGFHGAGDHSFFALVGHNLVQAPFVLLLGANVFAARLPSLLAALGLLVVVATLTWRWFGAATAVFATALLAFWRTGLLDTDYGFALLSLARQGRYDLTAAFWMACVILCLDSVARRARHTTAWSVAGGLAAGLATITQFWGCAIVLAPAALWRSMPDARLRRTLVAGAVAWTCVVAPYAAWVARHWTDARAQFTHVHEARAGADAGGVVANLVREPLRLRGTVQLHGAGGLLFILASAAAVVWLARRAGRERDARLLLAALAAPIVVLAPFDATKAPVYAFPLLWPLCIAVAAAAVTLASRGHLTRVAIAGLTALSFAEAAVVLAHDRRVSDRMTRYGELAAELGAALPPGAVPAGPERWWLALRDQRYVAFHALRLRWEQADRSAAHAVPFGETLEQAGITHILLGQEIEADLARQPPALRQEIERRIAACGAASPEGTWDEPAYGRLAWRRIAC